MKNAMAILVPMIYIGATMVVYKVAVFVLRKDKKA
jgi:hypothetical protein